VVQVLAQVEVVQYMVKIQVWDVEVLGVPVALAWVEEDLDLVVRVVQELVDILAWEEVVLALEDQVAPDQVVIPLQQVQEVEHQDQDRQMLNLVLAIYSEVPIHLVARNDQTIHK